MVRFGIYTDDFRFYYKAIKELKEWGLPFCSIDEKFDQMRIPAIVYEQGGEVRLIKECAERKNRKDPS